MADVTNKEQVDQRNKKHGADEFDGIHILINNAGGPPFGFFEDFDSPDWQNALELNLLKRYLSGKEGNSTDEKAELGKNNKHNLNSR